MLSAALSLQVGNNDVDDVNIIVFRQINQFDLSGNVVTSSEYLSTLWVRPAPLRSSRRHILSQLGLALACYRVSCQTTTTPGFGTDYQVMGRGQCGVTERQPSIWPMAVELHECSAQWRAH